MKKFPFTTVFLLLFSLFWGWLPRGAAAQAAQTTSTTSPISTRTPIITLDEIERGQKGWGLSVFAGTEPVRFEAEVIGVQHNFKPELSYILARLSGQGLEKSGIFRGMSGSPVYIDGRLAGAVAFSYQFGLDPIAGVTPIEAMRQLSQISDEEFADKASSGGGSAVAEMARTPQASLHLEPLVEWDELVRREFNAEIFDRPLRQLPRFTTAGHSAIQWSASGFGQGSSPFLNRILTGLSGGGVTPGGVLPVTSGGLSGTSTSGTSTSGTSTSGASGQQADAGTLAPGSSVAAVLVRGDLTVAGYGTVTDVDGDRVLSMGHPLYALGPVRIPMATSEVLTVYSSRADSFKISNLGRIIGAFDQDREAGVHGRLGLEAPMIPMNIKVRGLVERDFHMEIVDLPRLLPNMIAVSAFGALEVASFAAGSQGIDVEARFGLAGHDDLVLRQSFDTNQAGVESVLYIVSFGGFLASNSLATVDIESLDVTFHQVDRPRTATLISAHTDRQVVRPGETVRLILDLQAYRGGRYQETALVTVPETAPDGRFVLFAGDGTSMDGVRVTVERRAPETFEQALDYMRSFSPRNQLKIFGMLAEPGLSVAGEILPQLPGSVRSIFARGGPSGTPLGLAIVLEQDQQLDRPIVGFGRVDLEIRRR